MHVVFSVLSLGLYAGLVGSQIATKPCLEGIYYDTSVEILLDNNLITFKCI